MKSSLIGGLVGTPLALAALALSGQGQEDRTGADARPTQTAGHAARSSVDGVREVGEAYERLHEATVGALRAEAIGWGSKDESDAASPVSTPIAIEASGLLIAACPDGLLAGAPTASAFRATERGASVRQSTAMGDDEDSRQPASDDAVRSPRGNAPSGEAVGMLLVCSHPKAPGTRATRSATGAATDRTGGLEPGAYAIELSGDRVWLTDEAGRVVLRARIGRRAPAGSEGGASDRSHARRWPLVFGAITEEVMASMGWHAADPATHETR